MRRWRVSRWGFSRVPRLLLRCLSVTLLTMGCTTILGIDGDYVPEDSAELVTTGGAGGTGSGGTGSGGMGGSTGGSAGVGAAGQSGGAAGADASTCPDGQKLCSGECYAPAPLVGCSLDGCEPCPVNAPNAIAICDGEGCSLECIPGYEPSPSEGMCVPAGTGGSGGGGGSGGSAGTGGTGGTGGAGGSGGSCDPLGCPTAACGPAGPFRCCRIDGRCGCTWALGAICY
jgi:hypothetical protein